MEELYIEKFFRDKGDLSVQEPIKENEKTVTLSPSLDKISQILFFLRILKEDCEGYMKKAPFLRLPLHKLQEAIESSNYSEALSIMDDLEELLDIIHR